MSNLPSRSLDADDNGDYFTEAPIGLVIWEALQGSAAAYLSTIFCTKKYNHFVFEQQSQTEFVYCLMIPRKEADVGVFVPRKVSAYLVVKSQ